MCTLNVSFVLSRQLSACWSGLRWLARVLCPRVGSSDPTLTTPVSPERRERRRRLDWSIVYRLVDGKEPQEIATTLGVSLWEVLSLAGPWCGLVSECNSPDLDPLLLSEVLLERFWRLAAIP